MNKVIRGAVFFVEGRTILCLPLPRPLTEEEECCIQRDLEAYNRRTHQVYELSTEGTAFHLTPSPETERDANVSALREVAEFLAGPGFTVQMIGGPHTGLRPANG